MIKFDIKMPPINGKGNDAERPKQWNGLSMDRATKGSLLDPNTAVVIMPRKRKSVTETYDQLVKRRNDDEDKKAAEKI